MRQSLTCPRCNNDYSVIVRPALLATGLKAARRSKCPHCGHVPIVDNAESKAEELLRKSGTWNHHHVRGKETEPDPYRK